MSLRNKNFSMANYVMELDTTENDPSEPTASKKTKGPGAVILGAAMIAVGEILEPDKTSVEIPEVSDDHEPDPPLGLNFGDLPPLD